MLRCLAKMTVPLPKKVKIGFKNIDCIFHESNISDIHKNTIMESRNASLFENVFPCKSKVETKS